MTIGESMRTARKKAGLTQKQLAEKSGIPQPSISRIENDEHYPGLFTAIDLADALGITVDEYIGHSARKVSAPQPAVAESTPQKLSSNPEPFRERVRDLIYQQKISLCKFTEETGIDRVNFFYRKESHKHCRYIHMAIAYYFGMDVEELIAGTDAEIDWYGDCGI